jgi:GT2 family glycosyltransferase
MDTHPSISVIVPTHNRDGSLIDCLTSLMAQKYAGRMEIIVVEQGRERSREALDFFFFLHRRKITRIEQQKPNLPRARNAGVAVARGEVLLFIDDDVILPSHGVRRLAEHFRGSDLKAVTGLVVSESGPEESLRAYARQFGVASMNRARGLRKVDEFIGALMMVSAKAVRAVGGFDPRLGELTPTAFGEDNDFCYRLRKAGVRLLIDPSVRALHRDRLAGGCGSRQTDPALALKYHMKSMVYIRIKHHGRLGAGGWLQLARAYLLNREVLRRGPREVLRNFRTIRTALQEVKSFMAKNGAEGSAHSAFPAQPVQVNSLNRQEP